MPYKEHPVFKKPKTEDAKIWRYLDFTQFVSILDRKALWFSRADRLPDPFEGSIPKVNVKSRPNIYKEMFKGSGAPKELSKWTSEKISEVFPIMFKNLRYYTFMNCWYLNEYESAAMWNLYLEGNSGIAIKSTFKRLAESFESYKDSVFIGLVRYVDYNSEMIPEGNTLAPFVHKRKSYQHENELRAVIQCESEKGNLGDKDLEKTSIPSELEKGKYIPTNLNTLIRKIHIAPTSPEWLLELIESVTKKYEIEKEVKRSDLSEDPVY